MLRGGVRGRMAVADFRCGRCDVDDPSPFCLHHRRQEDFAAIVSAGQVYCQSLVPKIVRHVRKAYSPGDTGVVDENLHIAPARFYLFAETPHLISARDIIRQGKHLRAVFTYLFSRGVESVSVARGDHDPAVLPGQTPRRALAPRPPLPPVISTILCRRSIIGKKNIISPARKRNRRSRALASR